MVYLVDLMEHLGDVLLTTPALEKIRKKDKSATIIALVQPSVAPAVQNHPAIDEVITIDKGRSLKSLFAQLRLVLHLRRKSIDMAYIFHGKTRGSILAWLAGAKVIRGALRGDRHKWARLFINAPVDYPKQVTHGAEHLMKMVVDTNTEPLRVSMASAQPSHVKNVNDLLQSFGIKPAEDFVTMCVRGTYPLKNWPQDYFQELISLIYKKHGFKTVITGAPGDSEYIQQVINSQIKLFCYNAAGKTSINELQVIIAKSKAFITVDTGAMHVAATTETPLVALFGCTTPDEYGPVRPQNHKIHVLYKRMPCSPCRVKVEECLDHKCLRDIPAAEVYKAFSNLVSEDKE